MSLFRTGRVVALHALLSLLASCWLCSEADAAAPGTALYSFNNGALFPQDLALDAAGRVYVADLINGCVTVFAPMSTLPGAGNGSVLFTFTAEGPGSPRLNWPASIALDAAGNIYVGDSGNFRVVVLAAVTSATPGAVLQSIYATSAQLDWPDGMTLDAAGNIYVVNVRHSLLHHSTNADLPLRRCTSALCTVQVLDNAGRCLVYVFASLTSTTAAPGSQLMVVNDTTLALSASGAIVLDPQGNMSSASPRSALRLSASLPLIAALLCSAWILCHRYIADCSNNRIVVLASLTSTAKPASQIASLLDPLQPFNCPNGIALDAQGRIHVADQNNNRVVVLAPLNSVSPAPGSVLFTFSDASRGGLNQPYDLKLDAAGNILVADYGNNRVAVLASITSTTATPGTEIFNFRTSPYKGFNLPGTVVVDRNGVMYVTDRGNNQIVVLASISSTSPPPGTQLYAFASSNPAMPYTYPNGLALDAAGNLYVVLSALNSYNNSVLVLASITSTTAAPGTLLHSFQDSTARLATPWGLALDAVGNMYVADAGSNRIVVLASISSTTAAPGTELYSFTKSNPAFHYPLVGIALDSAGNIYTVDATGGILFVLASLTSTTVKPGSQLWTFTDSTNPFVLPEWPALDAAGNMYVSDVEGGYRVAVLASLTSGNAAPGTELYSFTNNQGGRPLWDPHGIAIDAANNIYVVDLGYNCVVVMTGLPLGGGGSGSSTSSSLAAGSIAAIVLGVVLGLFCLSVLAAAIVVRRHLKQSTSSSTSGENGEKTQHEAVELGERSDV